MQFIGTEPARGGSSSYGIGGGNHIPGFLTLENVTIDGYRTGCVLPARGVHVITGGSINGVKKLVVPTPWGGRLIIDGLKFVLDKLVQVVDAELNDDTVLRERLLDAQMKLELGELSMEEFSEIERDVFARLRELRGGHTAPLSMTSGEGSVSVEATVSPEVK